MAGGNPTVAGPLCYLLTGSIIVLPPVVRVDTYFYLNVFLCPGVPLLLDPLRRGRRNFYARLT